MGGMLVSRLLPEHHLAKETQDVVRLAGGVVATMSALLIGLLIASAKGSFDTKDREIETFSANLVLLDRNLARYGPETQPARDLLHRYAIYKIDSTWPDEASDPAPNADGWMLLEDVQDRIRALTPKDYPQRWLQSRALHISGQMSLTRWLLRAQAGSSLPWPFLVTLVCWLTVTFTSFGLFAPRNGTAIAALLVCSLSVAASMVFILEMAQPFSGFLQVSSAPMREALTLLGR
jgi:hypothetical protein